MNYKIEYKNDNKLDMRRIINKNFLKKHTRI